MGAVSLSGADTLSLSNYVFTGQADAKWGELTFPNDVATAKVGKNGNVIFGFNAQGSLGDFKVRVLRGSADDKFLQGQLAAQQANFSATVLLQGQFTKKVGDGSGNLTSDVYILGFGIVQRLPEAQSDADGGTDQSVTVWMLKFANVTRAIT